MNEDLAIEALKQTLLQERAAREAAELAMQEKLEELVYVNEQVIRLNQQLESRLTANAEEMKQGREELLMVSNRLQLLVQNLQYPVVMVNDKDKIFMLNHKLAELFAFTFPVEQMIGTSCTEGMEGASHYFEDPDRYISSTTKIKEERVPVIREEFRLKNGKIVLRDYIPIWHNGHFYGALWTYTDVTEKRAVQQRLQEQKQFYENVLKKLPVDIIVLNGNREFLYVNPHLVKDDDMREWVIGKSYDDYRQRIHLNKEIADRRNEYIQKTIDQKQQFEWEEKIVNKDGEVEYHLKRLYPVLDEKSEIKLLIGNGVNITERKKSEEQIRGSEKRYRDLFNYSQALICTHDLEGKLLSVNPALCASMGFEEKNMVGKMLPDFLPVEDQPFFKEYYLDKIIATGKLEGEFRVVNKDGSISYLLYQNYKMEEAGMDTYVIGFSQDITARVNTEIELRRAKRMTEEMAHAKEVFLANMSHEIRTPMTAILGIAGLLGKTDLDKRQREYLKLIHDSANNLLMIVNDVLDLEKIIAGKLKFEHVVFLVCERVDMCVQSFRFKAEEKGIALIYKDGLADGPAVMGDPYKLSQVLNNFISNAIKFTEQGSVVVETSIYEKKENSIWIRFDVTDTGIGIHENTLEEIFEPFVQANSAVSRKYGGTGLGLSICRELIHLLNGKLEVTSDPGKGSTFGFVLPFEISSTKPNNPNMALEINYKSLGKRKILVAEDVELNQYLAKHIMESWGFEVSIANNGKEAVRMAEEGIYDLILMDIQMPEMDGMEATRHIRQLKDKTKAAIPIVALTANALKGDSDKYLAAGMNDYLSKPFDEPKLFLVIQKNLEAQSSAAPNAVAKEVKEEAINSQSDKLYDLTMVEAISGGDQEFIKRMLVLFLDTMPASLKDLQRLQEEKSWDLLSKLAHKMKSTLDSMGIATVKDDIRTIEMNAKKEVDLDTTASLVKKVTHTIELCIEQLKKDFSL